MPITTTVQQQPPDIVIVVSGGGGAPRKRRLDVHVTWDDKVLAFVKTGRKKGFHHVKNSGSAYWQKVSLQGQGSFKLCLKRKKGKTAATHVVACAMDPVAGEFGGNEKSFA